MNFKQMRIEPAANGMTVHVYDVTQIPRTTPYVFNTVDDFSAWFNSVIEIEEAEVEVRWNRRVDSPRG